MEKRLFWWRCGAGVVVLATAPTLAMAYIDPGNGAYMVQALFTVVAAGIFYLRHPIRSVKELFGWVSGRFKRDHVEVRTAFEADRDQVAVKSCAEDT